MSAFSERVEIEDEADRLEALGPHPIERKETLAYIAARNAAREAYDRQNTQLQLVVNDPRCAVCRDYGCEFCPKVS